MQAVDRYVTVNGLRIHYLEWGVPGRPPLVLLHGIARCAHNFDHLAPHFAQTHHVLAVDLRGHGDSQWDAGAAYLVEDYTSDVAALIERLGLRNAVLWGNSTGGRVAQVLAGLYPEWVQAVIVEDVGPERPKEISNRRANRMDVEASGWDSTDALLAYASAQSPRTSSSVLKHFVEHGSRGDANGRVVWKRDPAIAKGFVPTELWDSVAKITAPIIYILGGASTIVPPHTQTRLRQMLPRAEIATMPGLGHYPRDEAPSEFIARVERFLRTAAPGR